MLDRMVDLVQRIDVLHLSHGLGITGSDLRTRRQLQPGMSEVARAARQRKTSLST